MPETPTSSSPRMLDRVELVRASLLNPNLIFAATWAMVLILHWLGLFGLDRRWDLGLCVFVALTITLSLAMGNSVPREPTMIVCRPKTRTFEWLIRGLWIAFILEAAYEYLWFGHTPLQEAFRGGERTYLDATIQFNVTNTFFIKENIVFLSCVYMAQYALFRRRGSFLGFLLCVSWSFVSLSRAVLIPIMAQCFIIYLAFEKRLVRACLISAVGAVFLVASFGWIEVARYGGFSQGRATTTVEPVPSAILERGLEQSYSYMVGPINNVYNTAQAGRYQLFRFEVREFLQTFVPVRELRDVLGIGQYAGDDLNYVQMVGNFNTVTFWPPYLETFGFIGTMIIMFWFFWGFKWLYGAFCVDPGRWLIPLVLVIRVIVMGVFHQSMSSPVLLTFFIIACTVPMMEMQDKMI